MKRSHLLAIAFIGFIGFTAFSARHALAAIVGQVDCESFEEAFNNVLCKKTNCPTFDENKYNQLCTKSVLGGNLPTPKPLEPCECLMRLAEDERFSKCNVPRCPTPQPSPTVSPEVGAVGGPFGPLEPATESGSKCSLTVGVANSSIWQWLGILLAPGIMLGLRRRKG